MNFKKDEKHHKGMIKAIHMACVLYFKSSEANR